MSRSFVLLALAACSGKSEPPPQQPAPADAAVTIDGITEIGNDPSRFTDPDPARRIGQPARKPHNRPSRPIDVILKSTPDRAIAAVDGVEVGRTPTYWFGESDGLEHTFTFTRPGYSSAIYRFVPIQSGTVHVRLEPVSGGQGSAVDPITSPNKPPTYTPADPGPAGPVADPGSNDVKPPDTILSPPISIDAAPGSGSGSAGSKIGPAP